MLFALLILCPTPLVSGAGRPFADRRAGGSSSYSGVRRSQS